VFRAKMSFRVCYPKTRVVNDKNVVVRNGFWRSIEGDRKGRALQKTMIWVGATLAVALSARILCYKIEVFKLGLTAKAFFKSSLPRFCC
jgi:hypothetical protein